MPKKTLKRLSKRRTKNLKRRNKTLKRFSKRRTKKRVSKRTKKKKLSRKKYKKLRGGMKGSATAAEGKATSAAPMPVSDVPEPATEGPVNPVSGVSKLVTEPSAAEGLAKTVSSVPEPASEPEPAAAAAEAAAMPVSAADEDLPLALKITDYPNDFVLPLEGSCLKKGSWKTSTMNYVCDGNSLKFTRVNGSNSNQNIDNIDDWTYQKEGLILTCVNKNNGETRILTFDNDKDLEKLFTVLNRLPLSLELQHAFLDMAREGDNWDIIKQTILKYPNIINVQPKSKRYNIDRWSVLHQASSNAIKWSSVDKQKEIVNFLLEHGANPSAICKTEGGKMVSAYELANDNEHIRPIMQNAFEAQQTSLSYRAFMAFTTKGKQLPNDFFPLRSQIGNGVVVSSAIDISGNIVPLVLVNNIDSVPSPICDLTGIDRIGELLNPDPERVIDFIVSDCRREILKALGENNKAKTIVRQMFILPSQLNGAEHPHIGGKSIPIYELEKSKSIPDSHWFRKYVHDGTGGPVAQGRASLEVAQEIVRISEANTEKRRETDWDNPLPINYVREVKNELPVHTRDTIFLRNGYLQCDETVTVETAGIFIQNMDKMKVLMSVDNPCSGVDLPAIKRGNPVERSTNTDKKIDMVYASAIPVIGEYVTVKSETAKKVLHWIGLHVIFNQYLIALSQACVLADKVLKQGQVYEVLVMPLGLGVFGNPALYSLIGLREAMHIIYTKYPGSKEKLDIKFLFWDKVKSNGRTDLQDFEGGLALFGQKLEAFIK